MNKFLNFNKVSDLETELYIYGDIRKKNEIEKWLELGEDITEAFTLKEALKTVDTPNLTVRIDSYGGSVSEGLAIYSLLSEFKGHLKTIVDGFACSAASVIFMAGEERVVPENGLLMIHNAWTEARGDANAMKKVAEDLEKITQPSLNIYVSKTGLPEEKVKEMMDKQEWITSKEAFELGFSTTQIRKDSRQSLEADFVFNLVMKNKELEKKLQEKIEQYNELVQNSNITCKIEQDVDGIILQTVEKELKVENGIKQAPLVQENSKQINEDPWRSFFNTKK